MSELLLPPAVVLILAALGFGLRRWRVRSGNVLIATAFALLWALSTPIFAYWQLRMVEGAAPRGPLTGTGARAIVVLGAGTYSPAPEYGRETVTAYGLERVRYAARLYRQTGLPIMLSGGSPLNAPTSEAEQMRDILIQELTTPVTWLESASVDTLGNAVECQKILHEEGITKILLVTHAWHMRRARMAFERVGLQVVPAPIGYVGEAGDTVAEFIPSTRALVASYHAWHETIGLAWYHVRFWLG
jgi:uncharacterized SAM-binding protein YcdF (DUF218 family)